jgi:nucleotide-binding universal stress UspA family protein
MNPRLYRSILVPLDGSAAAKAALRLALRLVAPTGEIIVAHVINRALIVAQCITPYGGDPTPALEAIESDEREMFAHAAAQARAAGVGISTVALDGEAAASILSLAKERNVDAIAMGTHGRRGIERMLLGNTAAAVLQHTELPTLVLHEGGAPVLPGVPVHILVALDATPASRNTARAAVDLAVCETGFLTFAHVAERGDGEPQERALTEAVAYARAAGVESDTKLLHGEPVATILNLARTGKADLIAVGTRGPAGAPFGIGSVAQAIARTSPVPVLVMAAATCHPHAPHSAAQALVNRSLGT